MSGSIVVPLHIYLKSDVVIRYVGHLHGARGLLLRLNYAIRKRRRGANKIEHKQNELTNHTNSIYALNKKRNYAQKENPQRE